MVLARSMRFNTSTDFNTPHDLRSLGVHILCCLVGGEEVQHSSNRAPTYYDRQMTGDSSISNTAICPPEKQTQSCQQLEGPLTSYELSQLEDEPLYIPPIVRPCHMLFTLPENLTWDEHCDLNRTILDELRSFGFSDPTAEDVKSNPYLAARVVLAIFRTRIPEYHVQLEFADIDHLIALVKENEILRETLAEAVEVETFTRMRCLDHLAADMSHMFMVDYSSRK
ncbi:hypothetical protein OBBRIDRAFT_804637 [Obba rivulosa]|uniref:Uncharacterized protein n=1 Tax=Obba rivulosa TaxID=1052685 RepID=A0A8E2DIQ6_9APHY|nr:hypothetical protein OBBRIDRAFT_804637 [Obba rivulosa]